MNDSPRNVPYIIASVIAWVILVYTIVMSASHIITVGFAIGLPAAAAITAPLLVDAPFAVGKLGRLDRFDEATRKASFKLMLFGGAMSLACNVYAGQNLGQRIHGVLVVLVMVVIENHIGKLKAAKPATVDTAPAVHATATVAQPAGQTVTPVDVPSVAPAPPVPAITTTAAPRQRVAPAAKPRQAVTVNIPAAAINPRTGQPFSIRHQRRLRTGR